MSIRMGKGKGLGKDRWDREAKVYKLFLRNITNHLNYYKDNALCTEQRFMDHSYLLLSLSLIGYFGFGSLDLLLRGQVVVFDWLQLLIQLVHQGNACNMQSSQPARHYTLGHTQSCFAY